jgi:thiol:disulfide interchange protein DsbC
MKTIFCLGIMVALVLSASYVLGFSDKEQDCSKCHTLKKDEAATLLKDLIPNPNILDVRTSPMKGMWEIDLESGGRKGLVYVDFSKKYMVYGSIVEIGSRKNLTQDRITDINRIDISQIPLEDALVVGDKLANYKVILFDDPD